MTRKQIIKKLSRQIITISYENKLSHIGSCITALPIIFEIYDKREPDEKVIISCGHSHLAHAIVMQHFGIIEDAEKAIQLFGIHCDRRAGCDVSTGSLGHGWGIATGMALANRDKMVYLVSSDGECAEGSCYEALNVILNQKISNIRISINNNGYSAYQKSNLSEIFYDKSFINIIETDMNDYPEYLQAQLAHYKILSKDEFEEVMEVLK